MKLLKIGGASMEKELREIKELLVELNENVSKLLVLQSINFDNENGIFYNHKVPESKLLW